MTSDVFRRAVDHEVHAETEWILQGGRSEGVVADADRVVGLRDHREFLEVDDFHQRVRRGLHPDHLRLGAECVLHVDEVAEVQEGRFDSVPAHDAGEDPVHPAVAIVRDDCVVSLFQQGEDGRDRAHPTGEGQRLLSLLEGREALLQRVPRRIRAPSVHVLGLRLLRVR